MKKPKVTIISLTYNQENYVAKAIESLVMQKTNFSFEIIISDDCSTDGTAKIIQEYAQKYPNIIKPIYREQNMGSIENFIDTMSKIDSEYVALCEGDDYWTDPLKLQKQVDFLDAHLECTICFHKVKVFFQDCSRPDEIFPNKKYRFNKNILSFNDILRQNFIQTNSVMYRWQFTDKKIKDIFPKDILPCDWFLHILHAQKGKIGFIDEVMADYRRHKDGVWWESSEDTENFHLKNGLKELNFRLAVEKLIINKEEKYKYNIFITSFANSLLSIYLKNKKLTDLETMLTVFPDVIKTINGTADIFYLEEKTEKLKKQRRKFIFALVIISVLLIYTLIFYNITN